jgi:hypothetical protein
MRGAYRAEFNASGTGGEGLRAEIEVGKNGGAGYNRQMMLARIAMRVAEVLFLFGMVGSMIVVIISFVEDWKELFTKE